MQNEKGLTLPEVLVAMVVLSLGLLALARMQITAIQVNAASGRLTQATAIAQDKVEQLMALPYAHAELDDQNPVGEVTKHPLEQPEPRPGGYTITWTVDEDTATGVKTINLTVTWSNRGQQKTFSLAVFKESV
jgi:prepilin-type N-terminal cleavage/methylation domain-containing protein